MAGSFCDGEQLSAALACCCQLPGPGVPAGVRCRGHPRLRSQSACLLKIGRRIMAEPGWEARWHGAQLQKTNILPDRGAYTHRCGLAPL
eukprot:15441086-Alexandrium_andersonii.AAC.1